MNAIKVSVIVVVVTFVWHVYVLKQRQSFEDAVKWARSTSLLGAIFSMLDVGTMLGLAVAGAFAVLMNDLWALPLGFLLLISLNVVCWNFLRKHDAR